MSNLKSFKNELLDLGLKYSIAKKKPASGDNEIVVKINNENLAGLFDNYVKKRKKKNGFKNHIIYTT